MVEPPGPVLVVVPTYDERENLGPAVARLHAALPDVDVLVVDDASPDGTGELADPGDESRREGEVGGELPGALDEGAVRAAPTAQRHAVEQDLPRRDVLQSVEGAQ